MRAARAHFDLRLVVLSCSQLEGRGLEDWYLARRAARSRTRSAAGQTAVVETRRQARYPEDMRYRMRVLAFAALGIAILGLGRSQEAPAAKDFRISLSLSPFAELRFRNGVTFTDGKATAKNPEELQRMFATHGANEVYARIATTERYRTGFGDHSMARGLERARMAKLLNLPFNPELGLFNIYGDVHCQPPPDFSDYPEIKVPGAWASLTLDQMVAVLRLYGALAAREILSTGVKVRIWDLGNEVEFGTAGVAVQPMPGGCDDTAGGAGWYRAPDRVDRAIGRMSVAELMKLPEAQRIAWLQAHLWLHEARLLAAVAEGIRSVDPHARFSTHVSGITAVLPAQAVAFYKAMREGGFRANELGVSYYPTSSSNPPDRLQAFKDMATALHRELGQAVFIAEFGYPAAKMQSGFIWNDAVKGYPLSSEGQANFIRDLVAWGMSSGVLSGIRPWAPDLAGTPWGPMSFFEFKGKAASARPALSACGQLPER
jgi:arabinogalactan endo-1,4-beta-galactosidase